MYMYLIKTAFLRAFDGLALGCSTGGSDHNCHLGGSLMGIVAALPHIMIFGCQVVEGGGRKQVYSGVFRSLKAIITGSSPTVVGDDDLHNLVSRYILVISIGYLIFRLLVEDWIYVHISKYISKFVSSMCSSNLLFARSSHNTKRHKHE
mmetsp:Transcript_2630/g.3641  ORF Transcript_2630/g.3641 Transcript_2630/m.3641 type:complete len:149 (+) Transcript_2630:694-1140(+)